MTLLFIFLFGAMSISFLCSLLESALMSTSLSFIMMKEEEGYKPAELFKKYKTEPEKPLAAILSGNRPPWFSAVPGSDWFPPSPPCSFSSFPKSSPRPSALHIGKDLWDSPSTRYAS
ncbi:MAG: DUF21 domain-containing protein [Bacteroidales bacterium]|nr:DUF21 domain-containing protein [Bacteroidales bacterium]